MDLLDLPVLAGGCAFHELRSFGYATRRVGAGSLGTRLYGHITIKLATRREDARLRVLWAGGNMHLYGETRPLEIAGHRGAELFILPDLTVLGEEIAATGASDKLYRDSIVYLTCLHEAGHALALPHNRDFEDIMYSFQYGGNIVEYFARYRRRLKVRDDIHRTSGLNAGDAKLLAAREK